MGCRAGRSHGRTARARVETTRKLSRRSGQSGVIERNGPEGPPRLTHDTISQVPLTGMRVAVLVAAGVEDLEYWVTVMRLREAGATVTSLGMTLDTVHGKNGLEARADVLAGEVDASGFDGLVIPGGWLPDKLRRYEAVTIWSGRSTMPASRSGSSATVARSRSRRGSSRRATRPRVRPGSRTI